MTTPVAVRLGTITGGVLIEVADGGPGMSTQDAIRAFDRFHRAADRPFADTGDAAEEIQDQDGNAPDRASAPGDGAAARWLGGALPGAAASPAAVNGASVNSASVNGGASGARPYLAEIDAAAANGAAVNGAAVNGAAANGAALNGSPLGGSPLNGSPLNGGPVNGAAARNGSAIYRGQHRSPGGSGRSAERTSGSGLGLSIVQAIANAHGGRATLESVPGQGTKVRVWLPVRIVP